MANQSPDELRAAVETQAEAEVTPPWLLDLRRRFEYHAPDAARAKLHETLRLKLLALAIEFYPQLPDGREKSLLLTHLEEAMFWANAAIARQP